jgi:hypothetical protein
VLKTVIADAHRDPAWRRVRPPLMALPEAQAQELVADLAAQGFRFNA